MVCCRTMLSELVGNMNEILPVDDPLPHNVTVDKAPSEGFQQSLYYDIIFQIVLVLGICGNFLNLLVLSRRSLRGVTYVYLFWLALADLLYLVVNSPVFVLEWVDPSIVFTYSVMFAMCRLTFAFSNMCAACSAFIITVLTVDRHRAVCTPLKSKDKLSRKRAAVTILCSFVLAIGLYVPVLFQTEVEEFISTDEHVRANAMTIDSAEKLYSCKVSTLADLVAFKIYVFFREAIARVAPVVSVTVLNIRIILALRKHQRDRKHLTHSADKDRKIEERRLVYLLIGIVIMFLMCTTPQMISWMIMSKKTLENSYAFNIFDSICDLLVAINAASNLYLYCFCSTTVRAACLHMVMKLCRPLAGKMNIPWTLSLSTMGRSTARANSSLATSTTRADTVHQFQ